MIVQGTNYRQSHAAEEKEPTFPEFLLSKKPLLLFIGVLFLGCLTGVLVFSLSQPLLYNDLGTIIGTRAKDIGLSALFASSFSTILLLAFQFLCGLSACGAPLIAVIPLFFGLGMGVTQAYYYTAGFRGLLAAALLVVPHLLLAGITLVFSSMEAIRMSLLFSRQLLPGGMMGGMWLEFKRYCVRFLVYLGMAFASGVIDIVFRLLFEPLFS